MEAASVATLRLSTTGRSPAAPPKPSSLPLTREERLAAWAILLDGAGELAQIRELDSADRKARGALRKRGSAASVAFADPSLRAAGLSGDSFEAVCAFFGLRPNECHRVLCQCGAARALYGPRAAATVRRLARRPRIERARLQLCAGLLAALGAMLGLRLLIA